MTGRFGFRRAPVRWTAPLAAAAVCAALVLGGCAGSGGPGPAGSARADGAHPSATAPGAGGGVTGEPIAGLFDIGGGRMMYLECSGQGSPTVVLVSGLRAGGDYWQRAADGQIPVFGQVAETTRVCVYDRPGTVLDGNAFSRSDPTAQPTTAAPAVADLHALLAAAEVTGPLVLAAHSYGGLVARLFGSTFPDEVAGLVLVDALSEAFETALPPEQYEAWKASSRIDPADIAAYPGIEQLDDDAVFDQVREAPPIRPMPVTVLSADVKYGPIWRALIEQGTIPAGTPADLGEWIDEAQNASQHFQATLVPGETHITQTHSGHDIPHENAALVGRAIRDLVAEVRGAHGTGE